MTDFDALLGMAVLFIIAARISDDKTTAWIALAAAAMYIIRAVIWLAEGVPV